MKKTLAILLALVMVFAFAACAKKEDVNAKDEGVLTFAEYLAAEEGAEVVIEGYITARVNGVAWGNCTLFLQDGNGAYLVYRMPCTQSDWDNLEVGKKVKVSGIKTSAWMDIIEIKQDNSTKYEVVKGEHTFDYTDVTEKLNDEDAYKYQHMLSTVKATVDSAATYKWDGSGSKGDDLYIYVTVEGVQYQFVVETDIVAADSECYAAVEALKAGDSVELSGLLYWYGGPQLWITGVKASK